MLRKHRTWSIGSDFPPCNVRKPRKFLGGKLVWSMPKPLKLLVETEQKPRK